MCFLGVSRDQGERVSGQDHIRTSRTTPASERALAERQYGDPVLQRRAGHAALARPRPHTLARAEQQSLNRQAYLATMLHTALHDAVIVTWAAKYQFNRSRQVMRREGLTEILTNDHHFTQEGFRILFP